jgi:site-specific DNA recombinase
LLKLAQTRNILIVHEYSDSVESAKDDQRPGFQKMLLDLRAPSRTWNTLLLIDTSRLSRRRYMAQVFKHEAKKRGVHIIYSKLPESDPIADMVIIGVMEVFDELHSLMSREKGLAGMAENVRRGFRAGGRAPRGYRLDFIDTGAVRDGVAVTKSKLLPNEDAKIVGDYLRLRAHGVGRTAAIHRTGIAWVPTSLIGMEWNALTYAGHTVWNVHNEHGPGGYKGGTKRRPKEEWVIQRDTHHAIITNEEVADPGQGAPQPRTCSPEYSRHLMAPRGMATAADATTGLARARKCGHRR